MSIKAPIRTVYDNSNNAIGLSEFQSGDAVGYEHGGTGLTTLGSANQVLKINDAGTDIEWADEEDLTPTGVPTGTFGSASLIPIITVGADGRITNISNTSVAGVANLTWTSANSTLRVSTSAGTNFDAVINDFNNLATTGVATGTFGSASQVPVITVGADGRITDISNTNVAGVDSVSYNTSNSLLTINTSDGGSRSTNITLEPFNTNDLVEGGSNLYFTTARARNSFLAGSGINIVNGVISQATEIDYGLITGAVGADTIDYGSIG